MARRRDRTTKQKRRAPTTLTDAMREALRAAGAMGGTKRWAGTTAEERKAELVRVTRLRQKKRKRQATRQRPPATPAVGADPPRRNAAPRGAVERKT